MPGYMAQTGYTATPQAPRGGVDFAVIGESFEIVKNNWIPYTVYALFGLVITMVVVGAVVGPSTYAQVMATMRGEIVQPTMIEQLTSSFLQNFLTMMVNALVYAGMAGMTLKAIQGHRVEISDAFDTLKYIGPVLFGGVLFSILYAVGAMMCCLPGLVVGGLFLPFYTIIVHEKLGAIDALKRSINLMSKYWLMGAVFFLVQSMLSGLGILACCVGVLFTMPLAMACNTLIYRDVAGIYFGPSSATVYPREGGGAMPGYSGPTGDTPPSDPNPPQNPDNPYPPQGW